MNFVSYNNTPIKVGDFVYQMSIDEQTFKVTVHELKILDIDPNKKTLGALRVDKDGTLVKVPVNPKNVHTNINELIAEWIKLYTESLETKIPVILKNLHLMSKNPDEFVLKIPKYKTEQDEMEI